MTTADRPTVGSHAAAKQGPGNQLPANPAPPPPGPGNHGPASQAPANVERRLTPADVHNVRFARASMMRPGYVETEVDRVMSRLAEELGRLVAEKSALRDQVRALQAQVQDVTSVPPPSDQ